MNTHIEEPQCELPPIQDFLDVLCGLRDWTPEELEKRNGNLEWYLEEAQNVAVIAATLSDVEAASTELRRIPPLLAKMPTLEMRQLTQQVVENWLPDQLVDKLRALLAGDTPAQSVAGGESGILESQKDDHSVPGSTSGRSIQTKVQRVRLLQRRWLLPLALVLVPAVVFLGLVAKFWHSTLIDASKIVATIAVSASGGSSPVPKSSGGTVRTGDVVVYEAVVDSHLPHRCLIHLNDRRATLVQFQAGASGQSTLSDSVEMDAATCWEIYAVIVSDSQIFSDVSNLDEISWLSSSCARLQSLAMEPRSDTQAILESELARIIRDRTKTNNVIVRVSFFKHEVQ